MKRVLACLLVLSLVCTSFSVVFADEEEITDKERYENYMAEHAELKKDNRIIVKMKETFTQTSDNTAAMQASEYNMAGTAAVKAALASDNIKCSVVHTIEEADISVIEVASGSIDSVLDVLNGNENVVYAQPDYKVITTQADIDTRQWAIQNYGQTLNSSTGEAGFDINLIEAWEITRGAEDVVVGVIDTGIDINHPALASNIWTNPDENAADIHGWDFVNDDSSVYDMDILDEHGTHMAGIIAADGEIKGVAPHVKILPLKALNHSSGYTSDIIEAIEYAKSKGVKIINCSFASIQYNHALEEAIASNPDILFVCAAGNYGASTNEIATFPACYDLDNIIAVSAANNKGRLSTISSYGEHIDVAAPGIGIYSALPENEYGYKDGTSCAAAYVSGAAALILSANRDLNAVDIKNKIINSAPSSLTKETENGTDEAEGLIDVAGALNSSNIIGKYDDFQYTQDDGEYVPFIKYPFEFSVVQNALKIRFDTSKGITNINLKLYQGADEKAASYLVNGDLDVNSDCIIDNIAPNTDYKLAMKIAGGEDICEYTGTIKYVVTENASYLDFDILSSQSYQETPEIPAEDTVYYTAEEKEALAQTMVAGTKYEQESNDTMALADITYDDYNTYGYMNSAGDVDYFKVKFSGVGVANFWLGDMPSGCDYDLYLYDIFGTLLAESKNSDTAAELISYYPVESDMYYYMKVVSFSGSSTSKPYLLRAKWYETPSSYEPNDTISAAYTLSGYSISAREKISAADDVDYYKIEIPSKSLFELRLTRPNSNFRFEVYTESNTVQSIIYTTSNTYTKELSGGTYYIKIYTTSGYSSNYYTLTMNISPITSIGVEATKTGTIVASNNMYYSFSLGSALGIRVDLSGYGLSDYDLYLYDSNYKAITNSRGTDETETLQAILEAGDYRIRVNKCDGEDANYTLQTSVAIEGNDAYLTTANFPSTMKAGEVKAVTVKATNRGARVWTAQDGYMLAALNDSLEFVSEDIFLNSADSIGYGQDKSFIFNLTAPADETVQTYNTGWRMQMNALEFGDKITKSVTVTPDCEELSLNNITYVSGKAVKQRYMFTVTSAGYYAFRTFKYATDCDTVLTLYDSSLKMVAINDDMYSSNYYSRVEAYLNAGTYYIDVNEAYEKPLYCQLLVEKYTMNTLSVNSTEIITDKYEGYYKFTISQAGTYIIATSFFSKTSDTYLALYNDETAKNTYRIAYNDNDSSNYSRIAALLAAGTYYIRATTYDYLIEGANKKVSCKLSLTKLGASLSDENEAGIYITYPVNGAKVRMYDGDVLKISGTMLNVRGVAVTVNGSAVSGVKTSENRFECSYTPAGSGTYTITASGTPTYGGNAPSSTVVVNIIMNDDGDSFDTATTIKEGTERTAAIDYAEDIDFFMFVPNTSDMYSIHTLGNTDTIISVYNSSYVLIGYNDDDFTQKLGQNADVPLYLEKNNVYYIMIHNASQRGTGSYKVCVNRLLDDNTSFIRLAEGVARQGRIDYPSDEDIYCFTPEISGNYAFSTLGTSDMIGLLYDDDGHYIGFNNDISDVDWNCRISAYLTAGYTYYFVVQDDFNRMYQSNYQVIVNRE